MSLLFSLGLRESHKVGRHRLWIASTGAAAHPPGCYVGLEPEQWLVQKGLAEELGSSALEVKRPRFVHRTDFDLSETGEKFDWLIAQSVFSHTYEDLASSALRKAVEVLAPQGLFALTIVTRAASASSSSSGEGWAYPTCVRYKWPQFQAMLQAAGLHSVRLIWPHPRQQWILAGLDEKRVRRASRGTYWPRWRTPRAMRGPTYARYVALRSMPQPLLKVLRRRFDSEAVRLESNSSPSTMRTS